MKPLANPICFEQVDGSLIGGAPAILLTEPLRLEMGWHWEMIQFVVVPKMTKAVILVRHSWTRGAPPSAGKVATES